MFLKLFSMFKNTVGADKRLLLPIAGTGLYLFFYWIATIKYPGGSQADRTSKGFSWAHNYWCNLLNESGINGLPNPGRSYALTGMLLLCISLTWFWYRFAAFAPLKKSHRFSMQASAVSSMTIAFFIYTDRHDYIINIACLFALGALTGTFLGLYKMKWWALFTLGIFNLILVAVNNYLYYGGGLLYLPVVQKITFGFFLLWICLICIKQYRITETGFD